MKAQDNKARYCNQLNNTSDNPSLFTF
uniref:Uncharacterized protein n=1 Tax=Anguilla anguilla TaxID=7936 RepID=A0A0E9TL28_ANGAN